MQKFLSGKKVHTFNLFIVSVAPDFCSIQQCGYNLCIKELKKYFWELQLIFFNALNTSSVLFFALIDVSSIAAAKLCPVEKVSPRYLYLFTTSSTAPPKNHFSFAAKKPPFLNTITLDLSKFTVKHSLSAATDNTFS